MFFIQWYNVSTFDQRILADFFYAVVIIAQYSWLLFMKLVSITVANSGQARYNYQKRSNNSKTRLHVWERHKVITKHKRKSKHGAKANCGASNKCAARNKNTYFINKYAAKREAMHMQTENAAFSSENNGSALLEEQLN